MRALILKNVFPIFAVVAFAMGPLCITLCSKDDGDGNGSAGNTFSGDRPKAIAEPRNATGPNGIRGPASDFDVIAKHFGNGPIARTALTGYRRMPSQSHLSDQEIADMLAWFDASFR